MDFDLRFGVEPNVFLDAWNTHKANIKFTYGLHENLDDFSTEFNEEVENFLMLLKLVAERQKGRKTNNMRLRFGQLMEKLVVFSKVIFHIFRFGKFSNINFMSYF